MFLPTLWDISSRVCLNRIRCFKDILGHFWLCLWWQNWAFLCRLWDIFNRICGDRTRCFCQHFWTFPAVFVSTESGVLMTFWDFYNCVCGDRTFDFDIFCCNSNEHWRSFVGVRATKAGCCCCRSQTLTSTCSDKMETDVLVTGVCCSRENPTLSPFEDTFYILPLCESQLIIPAVIEKKTKWTSETPSVASNGCQVNYLLQCIICSLILRYVRALISLYKSQRVFRVDVDKVFPKCHQLADMEEAGSWNKALRRHYLVGKCPQNHNYKPQSGSL